MSRQKAISSELFRYHVPLGERLYFKKRGRVFQEGKGERVKQLGCFCGVATSNEAS